MSNSNAPASDPKTFKVKGVCYIPEAWSDEHVKFLDDALFSIFTGTAATGHPSIVRLTMEGLEDHAIRAMASHADLKKGARVITWDSHFDPLAFSRVLEGVATACGIAVPVIAIYYAEASRSQLHAATRGAMEPALLCNTGVVMAGNDGSKLCSLQDVMPAFASKGAPIIPETLSSSHNH